MKGCARKSASEKVGNCWGVKAEFFEGERRDGKRRKAANAVHKSQPSGGPGQGAKKEREKWMEGGGRTNLSEGRVFENDGALRERGSGVH